MDFKKTKLVLNRSHFLDSFWGMVIQGSYLFERSKWLNFKTLRVRNPVHKFGTIHLQTPYLSNSITFSTHHARPGLVDDKINFVIFLWACSPNLWDWTNAHQFLRFVQLASSGTGCGRIWHNHHFIFTISSFIHLVILNSPSTCLYWKFYYEQRRRSDVLNLSIGFQKD